MRQFPSSPEAGGLATRLAARRLREAGVAVEPLLKKAVFSGAQIDTPDVRVSVVSQIAFLDLAAKALRDEFLGFRLTLECDLRQIGLLYYAMASSETLGDALQRAQRYSAIANAGVVIRCFANKDLTICLRYAGVARHTDRHQIETLVTTIVRICRTLTNRRLVPKAVRLAHVRSNNISELKKFFGCPITFGADADEIVFDQKEGQLPLVGADPYLNDLLVRSCDEALSHRRSNASPLRTRIENAITPLLPHRKANLGAVARQLGMSVCDR
jgi:Arabinose-binding domain of AraC transcription regulator, N-term